MTWRLPGSRCDSVCNVTLPKDMASHLFQSGQAAGTTKPRKSVSWWWLALSMPYWSRSDATRNVLSYIKLSPFPIPEGGIHHLHNTLSCSSVAKSCLTLCDPMDVARQAPLSMGFSRKEYWSGLTFPSADYLSNPGIEPTSPVLQVDSLPLNHRGGPLYYQGKERNWQFPTFLEQTKTHWSIFLA